MSRGTRVLACVVVCLSGCGPASGTDAPPTAGGEGADPGRLVIIGGALAADNEAIYQEILDARSGAGPLCVVPTASGVAEESMTSAIERIDSWGGEGTAVGVLLTEDEPGLADDPAVAARLEGCSGFFFTGGSQSRIIDTFRPEGRDTPAHDALMARWRAGAVVAGTSAGAAMMGRRIIATGTSAAAFEHGLRATEDGEGVWIRDGMGFFDSGFLDQHFLARGRWGRLLIAALDGAAYDVGIGIDENTALVVDGTRARVVGASGVVVIDARGATSGGAATVVEGRSASGVELWLLGAGDVVDLGTLDVTFEPTKVALAADVGAEAGAEAGTEGGASPDVGGTSPGAAGANADPFARWELLRSLARGASKSERLEYRAPGGGLLVLEPGSAFVAVASPGASSGGVAGGVQGPEGTPGGLSAGPWVVTLGGGF